MGVALGRPGPVYAMPMTSVASTLLLLTLSPLPFSDGSGSGETAS